MELDAQAAGFGGGMAEAVIADRAQAHGQDMAQVAAHELHAGQGQLLGAVVVGAVLPAKRHRLRVHSKPVLLGTLEPRKGIATLTALATDVDPKVRACVAARRETPPDVLARLRKDPDAAVSATARKNPSYEPGFIERLLE